MDESHKYKILPYILYLNLCIWTINTTLLKDSTDSAAQCSAENIILQSHTHKRKQMSLAMLFRTKDHGEPSYVSLYLGL